MKRLPKRTYLFIAAGILFACVCIVESSRQPLTVDEGCHTFRIVDHEGWKSLFLSRYNSETHPPLFFILYKPYLRLLDSSGRIQFSDDNNRRLAIESRIYARLFVIGFSLAALALVPGLIRKMGGGVWSGRLAALIIALHPAFVRHSCNMRMYSMLIFLAIVSYTLFFSAIRDSCRLRLWIGLAFVDLCAVYTHYSGLILVASQFGALILDALIRGEYKEHSAAIKKLFIVAATSYILFLPWLYPLFLHTKKFSLARVGFAAAEMKFIAALAHFYVGSPHTGQISYWLIPLVITGAAFYLCFCWRRKTFAPLFLVLAPVLLVSILNHWMRLGRPRYLAFTLPLVIGMAVIGVEQAFLFLKPYLRLRIQKKYAAIIACCVVSALAVVQARSIIRTPIPAAWDIVLRKDERVPRVLTRHKGLKKAKYLDIGRGAAGKSFPLKIFIHNAQPNKMKVVPIKPEFLPLNLASSREDSAHPRIP